MVRLVPMTEAELTAYLEISIREYAEDKVRAGNWLPEEALERSEKEFAGLLPQGIHSPNQYIFNVVDEKSGQTVGMIWYMAMIDRPVPQAFILDIRLDETQRGKGYGKAAMLALEDVVQGRGLSQIELHVFGFNTTARLLYEKLGYEVTNINMRKKLPQRAAEAG